MFSLLFAFAAGYALGLFVPGKWLPFLLSVPASALVYALVTAVFTVFSAQGIQFPGTEELILATFMQAPVLVLGTYWARRKEKRNNFTF